MSLLTLGLLHENLAIFGLLGDVPQYQTISLEIKNWVSASDKVHPLTGVHSDEGTSGWIWNRRLLPAATLDSSRFLTYVGGHEDGLFDGTSLKDWQSGVVDGIEYESIVHMRLHDALTWTPRYTTGSFSVYWDKRSLYSDYSFSENVSWLENSRHKMTLRDDAVYNSITAQLFKRLPTFEIVTIRESTMVDAFTAIIANGARATLSSGYDIDWTQVETRKREMLVADGVLYFNQDMSIQVGADYVDSSDLIESWQSMGAGLMSGRSLFCQYFPFYAGSVELVSVDSSGDVTVWTEKTNLNFSQSTDNHFAANYDLGVITTGGYQALDLVLAVALDELDTEVQVIISDDMDSYPDQGIIVVEGEKIYYLAKTRKAFIDCIRGYDSTTAADHAKGVLVLDVQHGAATTNNWYVRYTAVPRVEYEVSEYDLRTANYSKWLDVRALANVKTNNIVQIVSADSNLASIKLTTDSQLLGGNLYGPIYYGTDTSKLTATGYDDAGNPVEDLDLSIFIKSGVGQLNGSLSTYTAMSNSLGQTYAFYNAPYSTDDTVMEVTKTEHVGSDTHLTVNFTAAVVPSEVWVFQILKHDPVLGTAGDSVVAFAAGVASEPNGLGYVDVYMSMTEDYNGGTILLEDATGVRHNLPIRWAEQQYASVTLEPYVRLFLDITAASAWIVGTAKAWLFQSTAVEWNTSKKRGARVILYEYSSAARHPITGVAGAYTPVRPTSVSGNVLVFANRLLPIPDPADRETNLGAYVVIAPTEVRCSAYGRDPFSGHIITSNDIRLRLRLPNTLTGVDESGALPIPYGWTLITEEFNIGAGLDGANFLTVNPAATGINQFSITGVIP
jgi:hypothetical protein